MEIDQIIYAYRHGYFPMPHPESGEIVWLMPNPRVVIPLDGFHASRSLRRSLRLKNWTVTINKDFYGVMAGCRSHPDTWITDEFVSAYGQLHQLGYAHSVEVWQGDLLAGGTYGVAIGGAFFAESKFHTVRDASKAALFYLVERMNDRAMSLLEVQFMTEHLRSLGAVEISRARYHDRLKAALGKSVSFV